MFLVASLAPFFLLATSVAAGTIAARDSPVSLPINRRIDATSLLDLVQKDRARASHLLRRDDSEPGIGVNNQGLHYSVSVLVGSDPTLNSFELVIDMSSAFFWVGANTSKPYTATKTTISTGKSVMAPYSYITQIAGTGYNDTVTIGGLYNIPNQPIGVPKGNPDHVLPGLDGVIGLGPNLLEPIVSDRKTILPTVTDSLYANGAIPNNLVALFFAPINDTSPVGNGVMTFGQIDAGKIVGPITYADITKASPANRLWGIDLSITYGTTTILPSARGFNTSPCVVDAGSAFIQLANAAFVRYLQSTGAKYDQNTGIGSVDNTLYANMQPLVVTINGVQFPLSPNAQIIPTGLNSLLENQDSSTKALAITNLGQSAQPGGLECVLGKPFMERYYTVLDSGNHRVGFAQTPFTNEVTNGS